MNPLSSKKAEEGTHPPLSSFLTFGAPVIMKSGNGRESVISVILELSNLRSDLKLVTGRPRLNGVVQVKLTIWMRKNKSTRCSLGLKLVQRHINISERETVKKKKTFKVIFGEELKVCLTSTTIPSPLLRTIHTKEDLECYGMEFLSLNLVGPCLRCFWIIIKHGLKKNVCNSPNVLSKQNGVV